MDRLLGTIGWFSYLACGLAGWLIVGAMGASALQDFARHLP